MRPLGMLLPLFLVIACTPSDSSVRANEAGARSGSASTIAADDSVRARRLWAGSGENFYASRPSPDGSFVTEIDWTTGDLAVRELATGNLKRITNKGPWSKSIDYAESSVVSPDGGRIVYAWFKGRDASRTRGYELRSIKLDGSGMRVLIPASETITYFVPTDWSKDGRSVVVTVYRKDSTTQLALVDANTGAMRVLKSFDWRDPQFASFSPDSRWLAYSFSPDESRVQRRIHLLAVDGSREREGEYGMPLGFEGDGSLLYYQDRSIFRQRLEHGVPQGAPTLVRAEVWGLVPLGMTRAGYVHGVTVSRRQVHTATLDLPNGRVTNETPIGGAPRPSRFGRWSPDGKFLAFLTDTSLVVRGADSEDEREIVPRLGNSTHLEWHPRGDAIYVFGIGAEGEGLYRVDLQSGKSSRMGMPAPSPAGVEVQRRHYKLDPDGKTIYARGRDVRLPGGEGSGAPAVIYAYDLEARTVRAVRDTRGNGGLVGISRDGALMAYCEANWPDGPFAVKVAPVGGGDARTVYEFDSDWAPLGNRQVHEWTPDNQHVLFTATHRKDGRVKLLLVPAAGGAARTLLTHTRDQGPIWHPSIHPGGRRIAFESGVQKSEMWILESRGGADVAAGRGR